MKYPLGMGAVTLAVMGAITTIYPPPIIAKSGLLAAFVVIGIAEFFNTQSIESDTKRKNTELSDQLTWLRVDLHRAQMSLAEVLKRPSEAKAVADEIIQSIQKESDQQLIASAHNTARNMREFEKKCSQDIYETMLRGHLQWEASKGLPEDERRRLSDNNFEKSAKLSDDMESEFRNTFATKASDLRDEMLRRVRRRKNIETEWHVAFSGFYSLTTDIGEAADYLDKLATELQS
ncbi:MAG TPA: hypothetical protein VKT33_05490 [Candidatus Angelobacter sp.]|nr:hypothetical protein [Candidatus Angelobacter sp.]